jgi:cbb3-type cytochrome oxidase maturation protein
MESLIILIPLSVVLVASAMAIFLWAVNNGQFDQLDRDAGNALQDTEASRLGSKPNPTRGAEPEE